MSDPLENDLLDLLESALKNARSGAGGSFEVENLFRVQFRDTQLHSGQPYVKVMPLGDSEEDFNYNFTLACLFLKALGEPFSAVQGEQMWWLEVPHGR